MKKRIINLLIILALMVSLAPVRAVAGSTLVWPVPGHHTLSQGYHDGNAIDISDGSIAGANILAAMGGQVVAIYLCPEQHYGSDHDCHGFGTGLAILGDDGRAYNYAHMMPNSIPSGVYYGARVEAGQLIGQVGTTGNSTGYHLHFGISYTANYWEAGPNPANESYYPDGTIGGDAGLNYGDSFYAHIVYTSGGSRMCLAAIQYGVKTQVLYENYPHQIWHFIRQDSTTNAYKIVNECYSYCMNADNDGKTDGTGVGIWKDNGNSAERWLIMSDGTIQCCNSGLVLGTGSNNSVVLRDKNGSNALHLQILSVKEANGTEYVKPGKPGKVTYPEPLTAIVNESSTIRWNAVPPVNAFDLRHYTVRIYDGNMNLLKTFSDELWNDLDYTFPSVGTYYIQTDAVNGFYFDLETLTYPLTTTGSTTAITVKPTGPVITSHPESVSAAVGENATFSVQATGTNLTYQWQYKTPTSSWINSTITGAKTAALPVAVTAARNGYQYRCVITDSYGTVATSDPAELRVKTQIITQPRSESVPVGSSSSITVEATGAGLTYQWQYRTSATGTWKDSKASGCQTPTLAVTSKPTYNGYQHRCVITDANGETTYSSVATLWVETVITAQPANRSGNEGDTVDFTVEAAGAGLTYQWYYRASAAGSWAKSSLTGSETATLSVKATVARNGYQYKCLITDANGKKTYSSAATLTVTSSAKPTITTQPKSQTAAPDTTVKFTVKASGTGLTYQWYYRTGSTGTWAKSTLTGAKTATLSVSATAARNGYQYKCKVSNAAGYVYTKAVTLTVNAKPVITSQPKSQIIAAGTTVNFTVKATGATAYQWYYKTPTGTWTKCAGTGYNTAALTVSATAARNGYQYKCRVSNDNGYVYTSAVTLTVT
ncbi:MAG: immunoglobulin domain-containing protein [Oscillospiraceae bacterium]|nr:immunoglobulin domain-containing protein [Oscillospiraceae bacterium]